MPPDDTASDPPLLIVAEVTLPPDDTVSDPPPMDTSVALPPTVPRPPLSTVMELAVPPDNTVSKPPSNVAPALPPDDTVSLPPLLIVSFIDEPPGRPRCRPPTRLATRRC